MPHVIDKIAELRKAADGRGLDLDIEVDGGITLDNVASVKAAGANVIVAGNTVFGAKDLKEVISRLRNG